LIELIIRITGTDTGEGTESLLVNVLASIKDTTIGLDVIELAGRVFIEDEGLSSEQVSVLIRTLITDEGLGEEAIKIIHKIKDSGSGHDIAEGKWNEWLTKTYERMDSPYSRKVSPYHN